ncbi:MAG: histidine kinase [Bacteroidetes bacterium]|nr:histidine kinase [Bacteroidota bacterium]
MLFGWCAGLSASDSLKITEWRYGKGLPAKEIHAIAQDPNGLWYVGTELGLFQFDGVSFTPFFPPDVIDPIVSNTPVLGLLTDSVYLYATNNNFAIKISLKTRKVEKAIPLPGLARFIDPFGKNELLIGTVYRGFFLIDKAEFNIKKSFPGNYTPIIFPLNNGSYFIVQEKPQLFHPATGNTVIKNESVRAENLEVYIDNKGKVTGVMEVGKDWLYGNASGSIVLNKSVMNWDSYTRQEDYYWNIYSDRFGFFWCTNKIRLLMFSRLHLPVSHLFKGNSISNVGRMGKNLLINSYSGSWIQAGDSAFFKELNFQKTVVWQTIKSDNKPGIYWMLCENQGVWEYNEAINKYEKVSFVPNIRAYYSVKEGNDKYLLFGYGVSEVDFNAKTHTTLDTGSLSRGICFGALDIGNGNYLLATDKCAAIFTKKSRGYSILRQGSWRWVIKAPNGRIFLGSMGNGIWEFLVNENIVKPVEFPTPETQLTYFYSAAIQPKSHWIWLGTESGIYRFNSRTNDMYCIPVESREYNTGALFFDGGLNFFAGSEDGVDKINLAWLYRSFYPNEIKPFFSTVLVQQKNFRRYEKRIMYDTLLRFNPNERHVRVHFSSSLCLLQQRVQYRYRIHGVSDDWILLSVEKGDRPGVDLNDPGPGNYVLEVQTRWIDGSWSSSAHIHITLNPAWHERLWIRIALTFLLVCLIAGIVYWFFRRRLKQIESQRKTEELQHRFAQSEIKALRSQINPHMFANAMQRLQYYIYGEMPDKAAQYVKNYSNLMRQTLNMSSQELNTLADEISYLQVFCELEKESKEHLEYHIETKGIDDPEHILIPGMVIQPFVENAFKHGFRKVEKKFLSISFELTQGILTCTVFNTGQVQTDRLNQQRESGNSITMNRLELYKQLLGVEATITYHTEKDGLKVVIQMPYTIKPS